MYTTAKPPPPIPDESGWRIPSARAVAHAASTALPPPFSAATPATEASGLSEATAACGARNGGGVAAAAAPAPAVGATAARHHRNPTPRARGAREANRIRAPASPAAAEALLVVISYIYQG